jgi:hypothetical protein
MAAPPDAVAAAEPKPASQANTRLVANVSGEIDTRLRLLATLQRRPANHVLTELLARELPTSGQLAGQLQQMSESQR